MPHGRCAGHSVDVKCLTSARFLSMNRNMGLSGSESCKFVLATMNRVFRKWEGRLTVCQNERG